MRQYIAVDPHKHFTLAEGEEITRSLRNNTGVTTVQERSDGTYGVSQSAGVKQVQAGGRSLPLHLREAFWWKFHPAA